MHDFFFKKGLMKVKDIEKGKWREAAENLN